MIILFKYFPVSLYNTLVITTTTTTTTTTIITEIVTITLFNDCLFAVII